jgi:hypothetical protein
MDLQHVRDNIVGSSKVSEDVRGTSVDKATLVLLNELLAQSERSNLILEEIAGHLHNVSVDVDKLANPFVDSAPAPAKEPDSEVATVDPDRAIPEAAIARAEVLAPLALVESPEQAQESTPEAAQPDPLTP